MRGYDRPQTTMLTLVNPEKRIAINHPIRLIKALAEVALKGEEFGEMARHRRLRRFSGVPKIAQSPAHGAISVILPENPQHLGLAGGEKGI